MVDPIPFDQFIGTYRITSEVDGWFGIPFLGVEEGADLTFEIRKGHSYNTRVFDAFYAIGHRGGEQPTAYEFTIAGDETIFQKHQFSSYRGKCTFRAPTILLGPDREYAQIDPLDDSSFALQLVEGYLGFDGECGFGTHVSKVGFTKQ